MFVTQSLNWEQSMLAEQCLTSGRVEVDRYSKYGKSFGSIFQTVNRYPAPAPPR